MFRLFGKKKEAAPAPTLDDASANISTRVNDIDLKLKGMDEELLKYKKQMATMKPGPAKENIKRRAMTLLKQKRMYEKNRDVMQTQQFNIDQTKFTQANLKDTMTTVSAMKAASKELKQQFDDVNIDDIEDIHDDMEDMMFMHEEINEVMGRTYGVPEELDEADLMDELEGLEQDAELDMEADAVPNYLVNANTATTTAKVPQQTTTTVAPASSAASSNTVAVDEFGLPIAPTRNIQI